MTIEAKPVDVPDELEQRIEDVCVRIEQLEERLKVDSGSSSKPPSSDTPDPMQTMLADDLFGDPPPPPPAAVIACSTRELSM